MFDEKVILTRLQNGESVEDIANEMANLINKVNKTYADQKAAEEAAKAAAAKAETQKKEDLQEILDMFTDWFNAYYDIEVDGKLEADAVLELIDSIKEYIEALNDLESIFSIKKSAVKATKSNAKSKSKSSDEKISDFLKQMGW